MPETTKDIKKIENIENELSSKLEYMQTTEQRLNDELETPVLSWNLNADDLNNEIFEGLSSDELFKRAKECVNYFSKLEKNNLMLTTQAELLNKKVFVCLAIEE